MKHALNRGPRIAYDVYGTGGPAVVLQHGLGRRRRVWREFGYVDALAEDFTVVAVDSLGHGDSDKPVEAARYAAAERTGDIAAVLDAEEIAAVHYVGYSVGGWLGVAMLAHRPARLLSLTIGNFDPAPSEPERYPSIDQFLALARRAAPDAVAWVTPDAVPGLGHCLDAVKTQHMPLATLTSATIPIQFWTGSEDPSCVALRRLHAKMPGTTLNIVPGDHISTMRGSSAASAAAIRAFLMRV